MQPFVHLHVHTQYSTLDGQASVKKLVDKALADGMKGMAMTDHGNMMGIKEFFNYVKHLKADARDGLKKLEAQLAEKTEEGPERDGLLKEKERLQATIDFMPVFGCEMYVARRGKEVKETRLDQSGWHLVVLAKNEVGYHNLIKLVSRSWTDGFYMRPRTDHADLERYREGLIVSSACLAGELPWKILRGEMNSAEESLKWYKNTFGDDFYLELQRHKVTDPQQRANRETYPLQEKVNTVLVEWAAKYGVKLICTNDTHFVNEEDAEAHDRLICLSTGKKVNDPDRMLYSKQEWFKTQGEMNGVFADHPEALRNTLEILSKVEEYSIDHGPIMPNFDIPLDFGTEEEYRQRLTEKMLYDEFTQDENGNVVCTEEEGQKKIKKLGGYDKLYRIKLEADYLAKLTFDGARKRYGDPVPKEIEDRLRFELHVMKTMGFPGYFLIVQDYIRAAREELGVSVGPGRGSAAGSAVAYCLGITQVDPVKYDLLFERFLNPDRISLPDIDVDFDDDGRALVLQWVTQKYGEEKVAHIITYGTMATKSAIRDVARVEDLPLAESNRLAKLVPDRLPEGPDGKVPKMNLRNVIAAVPELQEACRSANAAERETLKYAQELEGSIKSTGVHACGTIICRDDISDWVPVSTADDKVTKEKLRCTQYEGSVIEETGLIKMDFLGLKTLSILKEAVENIRESLGIEIDVDNIDLQDPPSYQLFCDGRTVGVFQFESAGMQKYLRELQPGQFEDLIAMNALYRPGPMQYIPSFINRKQGVEAIEYDLPCMQKYLKDTYGVTVYQEQVMLLSREIANFTRGESDTLRKAMGKKQIDKLNKMYPKFISGGEKNGYEEAKLEKIWNDWRAFASYAFNKSHATCYSWVAYQTAYLKANFPAHYMAGVMSRNLDNSSEITKLMDDCRSMGIQTLGPDVNESRIKFSVNLQNNIRFGLGGIKGMSMAGAEYIVADRDKNGPYKDCYDFVERINLSLCNRKSLEALILSGAFDSFKDLQREQYFEVNAKGQSFLDQLLEYGNAVQKDRAQNANMLFGMDEVAFSITKPEYPGLNTIWNDLERLDKERALIGIYLSSHPLDEYYVLVNNVCNLHCSDLDDLQKFSGQQVKLGGMVVDVKELVTKRNTLFGKVKIEDYTGVGELAFFGSDWTAYKNHFTRGAALFIQATIQPARFAPDRMEFKVGSIDYLTDVKDNYLGKLNVTIPVWQLSASSVEDFAALLEAESGDAELNIRLVDDKNHQKVQLKSYARKVNINRTVIDFLDAWEAVQYTVE
ncbi:MAG: DNA polymerase III subunit alpha [Bacteroidaceae bacterium]|nr:DNA polymerase III subunit alpha [Bacteroidaceae bacterium]